jgi:hypothetical protein
MQDLRNQLDMELPRCRGAYLEECPEYVWGSKDHVLEPKEDGERISLQIGSKLSLVVGRNRKDFLKGRSKAKEFNNRDEINRDLAAIYCPELDGTLLDGEITDVRKADGTDHEGTVTRKKNGDYIGFVVWSCYIYKGKDIRHLSEFERRTYAVGAIKILRQWGKLTGQRYAYKNIRIIERKPATLANLHKLLDAGWEGAIVKDNTKPIPQNKHGQYQRTNTWWWKVKGEERRTVDAFIGGVTEAMDGGSGVNNIKRKPNGKAATFTMYMLGGDPAKSDLGNLIEVGVMSNLPDEAVKYGVKHFSDYEGLVVEMMVSGWDGKRFRWPRFVKWRSDKSKCDCLFYEQVGEKK